jgi:hypothetical protein
MRVSLAFAIAIRFWDESMQRAADLTATGDTAIGH